MRFTLSVLHLILPVAVSAGIVDAFAHFTKPEGLPRLVLLDRDGVINEDVGSPGILNVSQIQLTPNAAVAIGRLRRAGCKVVLITNQSCVGKGLISHTELDRIHDHLNEMLKSCDKDAILDKIYCCTSLSGSGDYRMKPLPGMIFEACRDMEVSPSECVMIGDSVSDLEAAKAGGISIRILVATGYGRTLMGERLTGWHLTCNNSSNDMGDATVMPFLYLDNLDKASDWLLLRSPV